MARWFIAMVAGACLPVAAMAETYHVGSKSGCEVNHIAAPDVAYQGGMNAHGLAVAPADLNPPPFGVDEVGQTHIDLKLPLRNYVEEKSSPLAGSISELNVGSVDVGADGAVKMNGHNIASSSSDCQENTP